MTSLEFPGMGGTIEVQIVDGDASAAERARRLFEAHEAALTRFRDDSELAALNEAGEEFRASPLLFDVVSQALGWACITDGVFDPTIIDDLESAGYDRPFDRMAGRAAVAHPAPMRRRGRHRWRGIELDADRSTILKPADVRIDLGGIGKGCTVDDAMAVLGAGSNAMVNASGDLYAAGGGPDGQGWYVGVQDPFDASSDIALLNVSDRGVATSGPIRRNWALGDGRYHHLIDARSGEPSDSDLLTATVIAHTATHADVLAKTAFLLGSSDGLAFVERFPDAECIAVTNHGEVLTTTGIEDYLA